MPIVPRGGGGPVKWNDNPWIVAKIQIGNNKRVSGLDLGSNNVVPMMS